VPPTGCRGPLPTPHAYTEWPRSSEMRRRRPQLRPRVAFRRRGAVRPSRRRSRRPRGLRCCRRAREKPLPRATARMPTGGRPGMRMAPGWRLPWQSPPPVADCLRDCAGDRRPQRVRRGLGRGGSDAVDAPPDVTGHPHHRGLPPQRKASTARRARVPTQLGRTRPRAAAASPQPPTAVATTGLPASTTDSRGREAPAAGPGEGGVACLPTGAAGGGPPL